jgi:hypothetical protein
MPQRLDEGDPPGLLDSAALHLRLLSLDCVDPEGTAARRAPDCRTIASPPEGRNRPDLSEDRDSRRASGARWGAPAATVAILALLFGAGSAAAAQRDHAPHRRQPLRLIVTAKPAAAEEGTAVKVTGRVRGHLADPAQRYEVSLQRKNDSKGTFSTVSAARLAGHRFAVRLMVPTGPGSIGLRLRLRLGTAQVAHTKAWRLAVRTRPSSNPPATAGPAPTPGSKTVVLSPATVISVPPPGEAGTMRLSDAGGLNPGDIVAVGIGPGSPAGFLGRVTSVSQLGGEFLVGTVPAGLPEALPEGEFDQELETAELDSANPMSAVVTQRVDTALECSAGGEVAVTGTVKVHPKIEIGGSWGLFSGLHAKFIGGVKASSELEASAEAAASCEVGPQTLFERTLDSIEFWVGPIPVVVIPVISASLSAEGDVEASVSTEVHGSITAKAGLRYDAGEIHPVAEFEHSFGWTPPAPSGTAHLEAKVSPTIDLLVYGIGGPSATFNAGLAVDASSGPSPSWALTAPISLTATLSIPVLEISTGNWVVYANSFPLAEG